MSETIQTAVARTAPANGRMVSVMPFEQMEKTAQYIAKSRLFPAWDTPEKVMVLMLLCQSEGRDPISAINRYDNIQGRVAKKAQAMLEDFIACGGVIDWHEVTDKAVEATFTPPNGKPLKLRYDWAEVVRAGNQGKDNYKKYPTDMLKSRLITRALRMIFPAATSSMYDPDELGDSAAPSAPAEPKNVTPPKAHPFAKDKAPATPKKEEAPAIDTTAVHVDTPPAAPPPPDDSPRAKFNTAFALLNGNAALAVLRAKKWIAEGQTQADLSDAQVAKLLAAWDKFTAAVEAEAKKGGE